MKLADLYNGDCPRVWDARMGMWIANPLSVDATEYIKLDNITFFRQRKSGEVTPWVQYRKPEIVLSNFGV